MSNIVIKKSNRIAVWDNVKFILIFLVVLGHVMGIFTESNMYLGKYYLYLYVFHMPAFIFVSGLFSKRSIDNKNYKKVFGCIVLY